LTGLLEEIYIFVVQDCITGGFVTQKSDYLWYRY